MRATVPVFLKLRAHSAESFAHLVEKGEAGTAQEMTKRALTAYVCLARAFNNGDNIIEINSGTGAEKYIDIFGEAAAAPEREAVSFKINAEIANALRVNLGIANLPIAFTNAYYLYDRILDARAQGMRIVARDPNRPVGP